jgi:spore coat protein A, manganese oxidase
MFNRRSFLSYTGATTLTLFTLGKFGVKEAIAAFAVPTLDPAAVPKFVTPLLIPPAMPRAGVLWTRDGLTDYYEISMKQFQQQVLPSPLPMTTVWGYGPAKTLSPWAPKIWNAPSLTIEANYHMPVRIKWINDLKDSNGNYLPHLLPVDPTLHWANPAGGVEQRDMRPRFETTPGPYQGPVPMVTHVHGAVAVGDESDGYAQAWYLPAAANIDPSYAREGAWYDFFKGKAWAHHRAAWGPGFATFHYPKGNRAGTRWYHDHTLGMTRLNVYAGAAGFYNVRGGPAGDLQVRDTRTGHTAALPGPAPSALDQFLGDRAHHEIALAIQDRSFKEDGSLFYPDTRAFFDGITGPFIGDPDNPAADIAPIWNPEFFGNTIMVNGNTWPFLNVEQRRYRFRFLNGCQARFLILEFSGIPNVEVWQIGNEGGFLAAPVNLTSDHANRLPMGPAERADVIVDFTSVAAGNYVLANVGPDEPFGGGNAGTDFQAADTATTGLVMQWRVVGAATSVDRSTPPQFLLLPAIAALPAATRTRRLALLEMMSAFADGPAEARLGTVAGDPSNNGPQVCTPMAWGDAVTENPSVGDTEVWELYNATADAHPVHVHETLFEVVDRQPIVVTSTDQGTTMVQVTGVARRAEPWESGFKDTVVAYPGEVTRIKLRFTSAGQYAWHCHIVEHEDNEMMRPYRIGPVQPGQPG